jgi:hypothetical protein
MTEVEWLTCDDPRPMLAFVPGGAVERKLRLFACACCRRIGHLLSGPGIIQVIDVAELYADKQVPAEECRGASQIAFDYYDYYEAVRRQSPGANPNSYIAVAWAANIEQGGGYPIDYAGYAFENACRLGDTWMEGEPLTEPQLQERAQQAALARDIFGNPFRAVTFSPDWHTDTVLALARQMYGIRDFSGMPILADALQDAGCDKADILTHCRDTSLTHVRGCWVVDLVLGKE